MKKLKIVAGLTWGLAGLILIIILFPGLNSLSVTFSKLPFMKLNPRYSGGELAYQVIAESCTLNIRKPVFNGLLREKKSGFVQLEWHGTLPEVLNDSIDYNNDGTKDFRIFIDRKFFKTVLDPLSRDINGVDISAPTSYGWAIRVGLLKE